MAGLNDTPQANRTHIAFFGLRNAGKSTLVNAFTGQPLAIVSDVAGTTTDPVSKAMEILPLGPCLVTDTAGLDDEGALGRMRVEKTLKVLETADVAVWVHGLDGQAESAPYRLVESACRERKIVLLEYRRGDSVEELKRKIAAVRLEDRVPGLLDGLVDAGDRVVCVVPIDESAPKGRLILPQQQVIRECLDRHLACMACQVEELADVLGLVTGDAGRETGDGRHGVLVVTDSQAFGAVSQTVKQSADRTVRLTSFSILFARQKGDIGAYVKGLAALMRLKDGDRVLVAEGCTHHRQCNDIGAVKIPKALKKLTGKELSFEFASGSGFLEPNRPDIRQSGDPATSPYALVVQCGGCMLTRREVLRRIGVAREAGIPIVNYGMVLAAANGLTVENVLV